MRLFKLGLIVLSALIFTGCSAAMTHSISTSHSDGKPLAQWPLRFSSHSFSSFCYDTYGCTVNYAGPQAWDSDTELTPSSSSIGPHYRDGWRGIHLMIRNFPPPAEVRWRSKDGELHEARIDIGEIFKDQLILHRTPREDVSLRLHEGDIEPSIILEVNDRTIRIYMRATVPTRELQIPGNPASQARRDLILVRTFNY